MKLQLQRELLLKPLQMVIGVVERKQTLPILSNVLLDTMDTKLSITGTDLEVELIGQIDLAQKNIEANKITVPGRKLMDICKALPDGAPIELHQQKDRVILTSGRSRFTLSTLPANDFPNLDEQTHLINFEIPQSQLHTLLQHTYFAMAQQDVRYYLNGMLFEITDNTITAVATDGHRLAFNTTTCNVSVDHKLQIIIPRKGITELLRLLEDNDDTVNVSISNSHIRINNEGFTFTSKLIDGRFPDYNSVIPKQGNKKLIINSETLKHSLQRTAILCNEKFRGVRFTLKNNLLKIHANNPEQEAAEEELVVNYDRELLDIGFNVNYLLDILNTVKEGDIQFTFTDSNSSMLIEESGGNGSSLYVVMPMRL